MRQQKLQIANKNQQTKTTKQQLAAVQRTPHTTLLVLNLSAMLSEVTDDLRRQVVQQIF